VLMGLLPASFLTAQKIIPLYEGSIPNASPCDPNEIFPAPGRVAHITTPTLTAFFPAHSDSLLSAVIICPGGSYARLSIDPEGNEVAKEFNRMGIAAFVLKYRVPNDSCMTHKEIVPLQDAQRAIQIVRGHATEWNINPSKIGIAGFSAGGHLASTTGTHFYDVIENTGHVRLQPDFMILVYPVISFTDELAHQGSRDNLLGKDPNPSWIEIYSNERQVTARTPPTYLVAAADDKTVKVENSIAFFQALQKYKVPSELHIYEKGGHGFALHNKTTKDYWFDNMIHWMEANGLK